jgi:hypothetical protein
MLDKQFAELMSAINENLAIDSEFSYSLPIDGDEEWRTEVFCIDRLSSESPNYATHVKFTMYTRFEEEIFNSEVEDKIKYTLENLAVYIKAVHSMRSEMLYIDPILPEDNCEHCKRIFRGPALFCSLDCAIMGSSQNT